MRHVITGATGLIGKRLIEHWLDQKHDITIVGRTKKRIEKQFGHSVRAVTWDTLSSDDLKSAAVVVNLAGASVGDKRWSDAYKKEIISSRVESTKKLVSLLMELKENSPRLLNASAIGIYGLQTQSAEGLPPALDEDKPIDWGHPKDFLSLVGQEWEKAAEPAINQGIKVVFMRFGVVLAKDGGALPKLVRPFQFFVGGPIGTGNQAFSWVAIDDVIRAIDFLANKPDASGPYNIVAPKCVRERELAQTIAKVMGRPNVVRMPVFILERMLGKEMTRELLLEGQHVYPRRLLDVGFTFTYSDIESALYHLK